MHHIPHPADTCYKTRCWAYLLTTILSALPAEKLLGRTVATWKRSQHERNKNSDEWSFKFKPFRLLGWDLAIPILSNQGHLFLSHQAGTNLNLIVREIEACPTWGSGGRSQSLEQWLWIQPVAEMFFGYRSNGKKLIDEVVNSLRLPTICPWPKLQQQECQCPRAPELRGTRRKYWRV